VGVSKDINKWAEKYSSNVKNNIENNIKISYNKSPKILSFLLGRDPRIITTIIIMLPIYLFNILI